MDKKGGGDDDLTSDGGSGLAPGWEMRAGGMTIPFGGDSSLVLG